MLCTWTALCVCCAYGLVGTVHHHSAGHVIKGNMFALLAACPLHCTELPVDHFRVHREKDFAADVKVPVLVIAAKGDPCETIKEVLDTKDFGSKCDYHRFDDMTHGFCGARGDFTQPEVAQRAGEAIQLAADFLRAHL